MGGGIIGLATARELLKRFPNMTVAVLEKEREVAAHQSGHNSGVIHAGIYYKPGSRMAKTCVRGADLMYEYCKQNQLPVERCGKLIVAVDDKEHKQVERLMEIATLNGVKDLQILNSEEVCALFDIRSQIRHTWRKATIILTLFFFSALDQEIRT